MALEILILAAGLGKRMRSELPKVLHPLAGRPLLAMPRVDRQADVLVLYGDVPLVRAVTLKSLVAAAGEGLAVLTAEPDDPAAYGRIVRDASGRITKIVEQRDATAAERGIREINAGF